MRLDSGARLGPYVVDAAIGAGGMGEVYRATDTNLKRSVAIKVLPDALAGDPDRLARFQREAEVLASLNHPNIAQVHGLERSDGTTALVMELVEGATLADRIAQGAVPVDEALAIAKQIAEALEAAHEQGIVHRDLKPANVKVRPDGTVKVLDFGLAKAMEPAAAPPASASQSPTITTPAMTQAGIILGTAAYMSPEQARGKAAGKHSDVWALGAVLYEMLSAKRAYEGEDVSDTLAAVLRGDPDWSALPKNASPQLRRVIERCLQRDPRRRTRDVGDVRLDLEEIAAAPPPSRPRIETGERGRWVGVLAWALAAFGIATSAVLLVRSARNTPRSLPVMRLELTTPQGVDLYQVQGQVLGLSPDGSRVAFAGVLGGLRSVYLRPLDRFGAEPIQGTETASWCCAFSPDGGSLLFTSADATLRRVSLADRLVTTVATSTDFLGADWGPDNTIVFVRSGQLWRVSASGGDESQVTKGGADAARYSWPKMLPDGETVLATSDGGQGPQIDVLSLANGARHTVVERGTFPRYIPPGYLLFYRDGQLLVAPFDMGQKRVTGATVRISDDLPRATENFPVLDVSRSGVLAYAPTTSTTRLVWVSRQGAERPLADTPRNYANPRLGPGSRWLLVQAGDLWVHDVARSTFRLLTQAADALAYPVLTPDGSRVVFRASRGLSWQPTDGSGSEHPIAGTTAQDYPASVSADGTHLLFVRLSAKTSGDIYMVSLGGSGEVTPVLVTNAYEGGARLSPDGRWLVYCSNDSGRMEVYLRPFPSPDRRWQVSTDGGTQPLWSPNGREIFYRTGSRMMAVSVSTQGGEPTLSEPSQLFDQPYDYGTGITIPDYDISADGRQFVMVKKQQGANRLNLVLNWSREVERLASAK